MRQLKLKLATLFLMTAAPSFAQPGIPGLPGGFPAAPRGADIPVPFSDDQDVLGHQSLDDTITQVRKDAVYREPDKCPPGTAVSADLDKCAAFRASVTATDVKQIFGGAMVDLKPLMAKEQEFNYRQKEIEKERTKLDKDLQDARKEMANVDKMPDPTAGQTAPNANDLAQNGQGSGGGQGGGNGGRQGGAGSGSPGQPASGNSPTAQKPPEGEKPNQFQVPQALQGPQVALDGAGGFNSQPATLGTLPNSNIMPRLLGGNGDGIQPTSNLQSFPGGGNPGLAVTGGAGAAGLIQNKPDAGAAAAAAAAPGGPPPIKGGAQGGASASNDPGIFNGVGDQALEPGPLPPKKVDVGIAAAGGGGEGTNGENAGEGEVDGGGAKPALAGQPKTGLELAAARKPKLGDKRTGHGIMDYVGWVGDSCHDKSEPKLAALCAFDGKTPSPVAAGLGPRQAALTLPNAENEAALAKSLNSASPGERVPASNPVGPAAPKEQMAARDISQIRGGLERAFSRPLPADRL